MEKEKVDEWKKLKSITYASRPTRAWDVLYLANIPQGKQKSLRQLKNMVGEKWFRDLWEDVPSLVLDLCNDPKEYSLPLVLGTLDDKYHQYCEKGNGMGYMNCGRNGTEVSYKEPSWMDKLPTEFQSHIRIQSAIRGGIDPLGICPCFSGMGFGYIVEDFQFASQACQAFRVHRCSNIRQLSFLHDPASVEQRHIYTGGEMYPHTRYAHMLDVYAVANLMASNNARTLGRLKYLTLVLAAITHDTLTPAGGDSTKLIDPEAFDEDANFRETYKWPAVKEFMEKWLLDPDLLYETINGNGVTGQLLNIADKSSYLARDSYHFTGGYFLQGREDYTSTARFAVHQLVKKRVNICGIWDTVKVIGEHVVVTDKKRLADFLILRALMFKHLYYNPYARFYEYLVGKGIIKWLYRKGKISRKELLTQTDGFVEEKIAEILGVKYAMSGLTNLSNATLEECPTKEMALERVASFENDNSIFAVIDDFKPVTSTSTNILTKDGKHIAPFSEIDKGTTDMIESIMSFGTHTKVFIFRMDDLGIPPRRRRLVKSIFKEIS